ncbi:hypothetical protein [Bradyrhizobium canariense]|nr:hypothetical protein [Bradyrhizobium canariense]
MRHPHGLDEAARELVVLCQDGYNRAVAQANEISGESSYAPRSI